GAFSGGVSCFEPFSRLRSHSRKALKSASRPRPVTYRSDIAMDSVRAPGAATCPFAAFPPAAGRDARLIGIEFQESERREIKTLRLHQSCWRNSSLKKLVRHE